MVPFTARPKRIACSTAPRLSTGRTPGSARSTADAWVLGGAPKAVDAPEKILAAVRSCACVSTPTTTSQVIVRSFRATRAVAQQLAVAAPIDEKRLDARFAAAMCGAVLRAERDELARIA